MKFSASFRAELMAVAAQQVYGKRCLPENKRLWKTVFYVLAYGGSLKDVHHNISKEKVK
jgi:hypothetical protein